METNQFFTPNLFTDIMSTVEINLLTILLDRSANV